MAELPNHSWPDEVIAAARLLRDPAAPESDRARAAGQVRPYVDRLVDEAFETLLLTPASRDLEPVVHHIMVDDLPIYKNAGENKADEGLIPWVFSRAVDRLWPADPDDLAVIAGRSRLQRHRDRAFEALWGVVSDIATQVCRYCDDRSRQELETAVHSHVWEGVHKYEREKGQFSSWCSTVLTNARTDYFRKQIRLREESLLEGQEPQGKTCMEDQERGEQDSSEASDDDPSTEARLQNRCKEEARRMLSALEGLQHGSRAMSQIDYFAVLLFYLRLAVIARLCRHRSAIAGAANERSMRSSVVNDEILTLAERIAPWPASPSRQSFRTDVPSLGDLWKWYRERLEQDLHTLSYNQLNAVFLEVLAAAPMESARSVSPATWTQWCKRAKEWARAQIGPDEWAALFSKWLPDQIRRGAGEDLQ